jgi:4-amino-4-deoxy-L-arabinose transferase-like glycosyltransferase
MQCGLGCAVHVACTIVHRTFARPQTGQSILVRNFSMTRRLIPMAVLVFIAAGMRLINLGNVHSRTPDERVYTYQAKTWVDSGPAGMRSLVAEYKADAETKLYPPPTRVGMIRMVAALMRWTGRYDESVGAKISCVASLGSLLVLALIGIRFLPQWAALAGMLFYAVLPADLAIARRTWTDALVELAGLLLIYFVCEITRGPEHRVWYPLFALVGSASLLVKESMPVPYGLCALWILWILVRRRQWMNVSILAGATVVGMSASLWWLSQQVGSLSDYVGIVMGIPGVNATNPYALEYASGPPYLLLLAFWIVAPITSLLSLVGLGAVALKKREGPLIFLAGFTVAYVAIAMAMPHWINLRYVGNTFGPVCLLTGLGCWYLISAGSAWLDSSDRRPFAVVAIAIVLGGAVADYLRFQRYFVRDEMIDLSIKMLVDERNQ